MKKSSISSNGIGGISPYPLSPRKKLNGMVLTMMCLVIISTLVPAIFLLGLHCGYLSAGLLSDDGDSFPMLGVYTRRYTTDFWNQPLDFPDSDNRGGGLTETAKGPPRQNDEKATSWADESRVPRPIGGVVPPTKNVGEIEAYCEIRYGSYCRWHNKEKENIKDTMVKKMKDLLFLARAYYPSIVRFQAHDRLSRELRQNIQDFERTLGDATSDSHLPRMVERKLHRMETAMSRAKSMLVDCTNIDQKLTELTDVIEDEAMFHMKQGAFLYQHTVQSIPKSLHCLSMRLTLEFFSSSPPDAEDSSAQKYVDQTLYHYAIISNSVLASSVVINSTVFHATDSEELVFHVLTNRENYYAMKLWFSRNTFKKATVRVLNIEEELEHNGFSEFSLPEESHVSIPNAKMPAEYLSLFSYSHYMLPEIFSDLDKIVVLDDDVVVQRDLSALWNINMGGKVNGALEHCAVKLGKLDGYLDVDTVSQKACAWMSGLNVVDLMKWRELDLTANFKSLVEEMKSKGQSEGIASRASLLVFQDLVYALDSTWILSGLGHNYDLSSEALKTSAVLHYNGAMKPWLELGIHQYKQFWTKYLDVGDRYLTDCNVNP